MDEFLPILRPLELDVLVQNSCAPLQCQRNSILLAGDDKKKMRKFLLELRLFGRRNRCLVRIHLLHLMFPEIWTAAITVRCDFTPGGE
jgi:hypothetical protein